MRWVIAITLYVIGGIAIQISPSQTVDLNSVPSQPLPTICGDIVNANQEYNQDWYYASDVLACLTSVPFNQAVATRFITYVNQTLQFHSTTALLRAPPTSYQQPAVDLIAGLRRIQDKVAAGAYTNQYAFEVDVQQLIIAAHDAHLAVSAGVTSVFTFSSPYDIVSVSVDGRQSPKLYFFGTLVAPRETVSFIDDAIDDLVDCIGQLNCEPSAIKTINNVTAADFLISFARTQSLGYLEPHADWNSLMRSPALDIQGGVALFSGSATLYPGDDLRFEYENGTVLNENWISLYNSPGYTGPLSTGGDFYNFFVLDEAPASYNATQWYEQHPPNDDGDDDGTSLPTNLTSWNSISSAYPNNTIVRQPELDLYQPGVLTGYLLEDISTAVLSIPSFDEYDNGIETFSETVIDFINKTSDAHRVIIDLQQNYGGLAALAFDTFRLFFPSEVPFAGSRLRASPWADALGQTYTNYFNNLTTANDSYYSLIGKEWVSSARINARTGQTFSSWSQFYGPSASSHDLFTLVQRYNLTDQDFVDAALGVIFPDDAFDPSAEHDPPRWAPEDIVLLTDGLCSSACALFVEMMTRVKGVRTVVVGGAPTPGPMQAVSGNRGAALYSSDDLDSDIGFVQRHNVTNGSQLPPRGNETDSGMKVYFAGINLRDQMRANSSTPNQFLYLPADCRIFWSMKNFFDYRQLWRDAYDAIYNDTTLCVPGSTHAKPPSVDQNHLVPRAASAASAAGSSMGDFIMSGISLDGPELVDETRPVQDSSKKSQRSASFPRNCTSARTGHADQSKCDIDAVCKKVRNACSKCNRVKSDGACADQGDSSESSYFCLKTCWSTSSNTCPSGTSCRLERSVDSKMNNKFRRSSNTQRPPNSPNPQPGSCYPKTERSSIPCKDLHRIWHERSGGS